jgi:hypothetical protein
LTTPLTKIYFRGNREQGTGNREQGTGNREQNTERTEYRNKRRIILDCHQPKKIQNPTSKILNS